MRALAFRGGPADGCTAQVDGRDVISVLRVAVDEHSVTPRAIVLTAAIDRCDLAAGHDRWVDYYRWPSMPDEGDVVVYRFERPPVFGGGFSASG